MERNLSQNNANPIVAIERLSSMVNIANALVVRANELVNCANAVAVLSKFHFQEMFKLSDKTIKSLKRNIFDQNKDCKFSAKNGFTDSSYSMPKHETIKNIFGLISLTTGRSL